MISRDPRCVHVADHQHEVAPILALLRDKGIESTAVNDATLGGLESMTGWVPRDEALGIEIWVNDVARADEARAMLARRAAEVQDMHVAREARMGTVDVECPSCGQTSELPAA